MLSDYLPYLYADGMERLSVSLQELACRGPARLVMTVNPELLMEAQRNPAYEAILLDSRTIAVPDGIGVIQAEKWLHGRSLEKIPGVDLAVRLMEMANEKKEKVFLYGARPEVLEALLEKWKRKYPGIQWVGTYSGYGQDEDRLRQEIQLAQPAVVLAALGCPAQERFLFSCLPYLQRGVLVGVGGSFDVLSGKKKRAPQWVQGLHCEWLWRILREPRRLPRFVRGQGAFVCRLWKEKQATSGQKREKKEEEE